MNDFDKQLHKSIAQFYANGINFLKASVKEGVLKSNMTVKQVLEISDTKRCEAIDLSNSGE